MEYFSGRSRFGCTCREKLVRNVRDGAVADDVTAARAPNVT
jgi:hypothetical protein